MFAVAYYTQFLLAILAPVGAYCYHVEQRDNYTYSLISELGWKSANLGLSAHLEVFHWDSLEECFGDTHQNIEWMNENNPSTLW